MSRFNFCGPTYQSLSPSLDAQFTMNWFPVPDESGNGRSAMAMYQRPGLALFATLPSCSAVQGLFEFHGIMYAVGQTAPNTMNVWQVNANGTLVASQSTPLINAGNGLVSMIGVPQNQTGGATALMLIVTGGAIYYFLIEPFLGFSGQLTQQTWLSAEWVDSFMVALIKGNQFQVFGPGNPGTYNALNIATLTEFPDNIVGMIANDRLIYFFGEKRCVPYYNSGALFPFVPVPGVFIEKGLAGLNAKCRADNTIFWLDNDERGGRMAYRMNGYTGQRISTYPVEEAWAGYATVSDCICWSYQDSGHIFVIFQFPTANATWAYDIATNMWCQRGYWNTKTGQFQAQLQQCHAYAYGQHFVGDANSGNIYIQSQANLTDNGAPIRRVRRAPYIANEHEWMFHSRFELLCETGLPSNLFGPSTAINEFVLEDANGVFWQVSINDQGILQDLEPAAMSLASTIILNDEIGLQSWLLGVNTIGELTTTSVPYDQNAPSILPMATSPSALGSGIYVVNGLLGTIPARQAPLAPQVFLRWSDDGGHTWSNYYPKSLGLTGEYKTRVRWQRLGRSRNRIYEVSCTEAYSLRIIDAFVNADPGFKPQERLTDNVRKMA